MPLTLRLAPLSALPLLAATLFGASSTLAGPLNPPAGAIASTAKPLAEVEPRTAINATNTPGDADSVYRISQPGSYYLTGNLTGVVGRHGIEIASSGVTIDLCGFELIGVPAMGAFDGINVSITGARNITVRNGAARLWGADGVDVRSNDSLAAIRVESISVSLNFGNGLNIGNGAAVTGCTSADNTGVGIAVGLASTVVHCSTFNNTGAGILAANGSTIADCSSYSNGTQGIIVTSGCTVSRCTVTSNSTSGIQTGAGCTISGCTAYSNDERGIYTTGAACTIESCNARLNTLDGISIVSLSTVRGCNATSNGSNGDGAGIFASNDLNRIEGNHSVGNDRGYDIDGTGNVLVRNTATGNSVANWAIAAANHFGPIMDRTFAPPNPAINGNGAGGATLGSTDPNANFTF